MACARLAAQDAGAGDAGRGRQAAHARSPPGPPPWAQNNKDYFDQGLDEVKLLQYVNGADPDDAAGILRLHDFFYFKARGAGGRAGAPLCCPAAPCAVRAPCLLRRACPRPAPLLACRTARRPALLAGLSSAGPPCSGSTTPGLPSSIS